MKIVFILNMVKMDRSKAIRKGVATYDPFLFLLPENLILGEGW